MAVEIRPYVEGGPFSYPKRDLTQEPSFGKWTVLSFAGRDVHGEACWNCRCECETYRVVCQTSLLRGGSLCCGCDGRASRQGRFTTHGNSKKVAYNVWRGMLKRCQIVNNADYENYGGRGITVCERWRNSFDAFMDDMGPRPTPKHQLDRYPDNDGHYEPGNCRWATPKQQANNRRSSRLLEYNGVTKTAAQWAEHAEMLVTTLYVRLKRGWSIEDAIERPVRRLSKRMKTDTETTSL